MKMGILSWLFGDKKKERSMPDFKKDFAAFPDEIQAGIIEEKDRPESIKSKQAFSDRTANAKKISDKEAKTASDSYKAKGDDVHTRIQTAKSRNYEIVWLLQAHKDIPYKSLRELVEGYKAVKGNKSYRGMSVDYICEGELYEISPLNEQDLEGLAKNQNLERR
jgi:hypothetical protein